MWPIFWYLLLQQSNLLLHYLLFYFLPCDSYNRLLYLILLFLTCIHSKSHQGSKNQWQHHMADAIVFQAHIKTIPVYSGSPLVSNISVGSQYRHNPNPVSLAYPLSSTITLWAFMFLWMTPNPCKYSRAMMIHPAMNPNVSTNENDTYVSKFQRAFSFWRGGMIVSLLPNNLWQYRVLYRLRMRSVDW